VALYGAYIAPAARWLGTYWCRRQKW